MRTSVLSSCSEIHTEVPDFTVPGYFMSSLSGDVATSDIKPRANAYTCGLFGIDGQVCILNLKIKTTKRTIMSNFIHH